MRVIASKRPSASRMRLSNSRDAVDLRAGSLTCASPAHDPADWLGGRNRGVGMLG